MLLEFGKAFFKRMEQRLRPLCGLTGVTLVLGDLKRTILVVLKSSLHTESGREQIAQDKGALPYCRPMNRDHAREHEHKSEFCFAVGNKVEIHHGVTAFQSINVAWPALR
jgi:hypothetical protein